MGHEYLLETERGSHKRSWKGRQNWTPCAQALVTALTSGRCPPRFEQVNETPLYNAIPSLHARVIAQRMFTICRHVIAFSVTVRVKLSLTHGAESFLRSH
jgi:hypothetical protein